MRWSGLTYKVFFSVLAEYALGWAVVKVRNLACEHIDSSPVLAMIFHWLTFWATLTIHSPPFLRIVVLEVELRRIKYPCKLLEPLKKRTEMILSN